ncbi:hypothetical protein [Pyrobaculum ferrireducens]|uniref:Uncharacterized protein n=1 Tax=Pyrobaculum ferrireducens TaxID=1104324 RepID=G7VBW8_9CREN|nr:hypothetical protein [Pyrobaculum ferrireducens]AET32468.1 hypothetical protein P186_1031 [Pyrobaculum ferrireducens]
MVTPLEVEVLEEQTGEVEAEGLLITYRVVGVKIAKVGEGYAVSVATEVAARFREAPSPPVGVCMGGGVPYRPIRFRVVKLARAVVKADGRVFDVYVEPLAVMAAEGFVTPLGEPCVAISTAVGWITRG